MDVRHSTPVVALEQHPDHVTLTVDGPDGPRQVTARYVVGCDGGNSFVRSALGVGTQDYGFSEPWMVCDFRFRRPTTVPYALQLGEPLGPTSIISLGPAHHRFSFMHRARSPPDAPGPREGRGARPAAAGPPSGGQGTGGDAAAGPRQRPLRPAPGRPDAGSCRVQGVVDDGTRRDRLDQIAGGGFHLLVREEVLDALDAAHLLDDLTTAGVRVVVPGERTTGDSAALFVHDVDGTYRDWLTGLSCSAVVVRPDFYVFGTASTPDAAVGLAGELLGRCGRKPPCLAAEPPRHLRPHLLRAPGNRSPLRGAARAAGATRAAGGQSR